jgi:glycosyltransferase involved in cell wall biosynthesis
MNTPKVSVIIPNYNHAEYLEQRIETVMNQRFQDIEVLLLDDASTDNSRALINRLLKRYPQITFYPAETNSGSPFAQWNKGAKLAKGTYLWIAESDDYAEPELLENLVAQMEQDEQISISYVQSILVNEEGKHLNNYEKNLKFIYKSDAWQHPFVKEGASACRDWLIKHNPIPNASGALLKKSTFLEVGGADPSMRLNGDWFLYAKMLRNSKLSFSPEPLNYFRVHKKTQRQRARATADVYQELLVINNYLREHVDRIDQQADEALTEIASWWTGSLPYQVKTKDNRRKNKVLYHLFKKAKPNLAMHIGLTYLIIGTRFLLNKLGLLTPLKKWRSSLFPGKYFDA